MQLKTLDLFTANLPSMLRFYRDTLECKVVEHGDGAFTILACQTSLTFWQVTGASPVYHFAFTIPWNKVAEAMQWTAARVPLLELAPKQFLANFAAWNALAFYFLDPAGNIVEFIAREPLAIVSDSPFSGKSLASVSEIGLVTDDVALACRQLEELWAVPLFSKQAPTPNFAAAGDDNGLFIVVSENRNWYPTNIPAVKAPLKAVFQTGDGMIRTLELS